MPDALAREAETCTFLAGCSDYRRGVILEKQFGDGVKSCPMPGKCLPELIAGELGRACQCVWERSEAQLLTMQWEIPPTQAEWHLALYDFHKGKAATLTYLKLKTD